MFVKVINSKNLNGKYTPTNYKGKYNEIIYKNENTQLFLYKFKNDVYVISNRLYSLSFFAFTNAPTILDETSKWFSFDRFGRIIEDQMKLKMDIIEENEDEDIPENDGMIVYSKYRNIFGGYVKTDKKIQNKSVFFNEEDAMYLYYLHFKDKWVIGPNVGSSRYFFHCDSENKELPHFSSWKQFQLTVHPYFKSFYENSDESSHEKFIDPDFICAETSIGKIDLKGKEVNWIRGSKLQNSLQKPVLFSGISPNDIMQGNVGDCWLMSALSSLAEFPKFIQNETFQNIEEISTDGKYTLKLYNMQKRDWIKVTVDDYVPCFKKKSWFNSDVPCFAQLPQDNELYILLIEKAFAKLAGSYEKINGGYPSLALVVLTGCENIEYFNKNNTNMFRRFTMNVDSIRNTPFDFHDFRLLGQRESFNFDDFFDYLLDCDAKDFMMIASINGNVMEKKREDGLIERHAYSILKVYQKNHIRLLKLRNPWSCMESNLEWNNPKKWESYPNIRKELEYTDEDDGIFWISADNFMEIFSSIQICNKSMTSYLM